MERITLAAKSFWLSASSDGSELFLNFTPVPEPATWLLAALGVAALFVVRKRAD